MSVGKLMNGYQVTTIREYPEFEFAAVGLKHVKTNARHIHVLKDDANNVFNVAFQTPPNTSNGVPHILEHVALCGSKRHPIRDPFFKMLNRSMSTFMNAMTGSDFTMYPFSTENKNDYRNLMSVYLDAAFHPNLSELDYKQEGWRLENTIATDINSPLMFKGVVYNEMKGAFSDSGSLFCTKSQQEMYPGTTYGVVSGGDPKHITELTHKDLKAFHAKHYHPSNATFFTYGDMELSKTLEQIDKVIDGFELASTPKIVPVLRFTEPKTVRQTCAPDPLGDTAKQGKVSVSFLATDESNINERLALEVISSLLISGSSSPMYKALIASSVGSGYAANSGYDTASAVGCISFGAQGVKDADVDRVDGIVMQVLESVHRNGFNPIHIDGAIHQLELSLKHKSAYFGMGLSQSALCASNHEADPFDSIDYAKQLTALKSSLYDPEYIKGLIDTYFLKNQHKVTFIMTPDQNYNSMLEVDEQARLDTMSKTLTTEDREIIKNDALALLKLQDQIEDLSCLPTLTLDDITKTTQTFKVDLLTTQGIQIQQRITATNSISYFSIVKDIAAIPAHLQPYLPLFSAVLTGMGTATRSFEEIGDTLRLHSGGIGSSVSASSSLSSLSTASTEFSLSSYFINDSNQTHSRILFSVMDDVLRNTKWEDLDRLNTLLQSLSNSSMNSIASAGHQYAMSAAASVFSPSLARSEMYSGLEHVSFMNKNVNEDKVVLLGISEKLREIAAFIVDAGVTRYAINATKGGYEETSNALARLSSSMNWNQSNANASDSSKITNSMSASVAQRRVIPVPFNVNYTAKAFVGVPYIHADSIPLQILSSLLTTHYLHKEIREKGGAYGGGARYSALDGYLSMYSYRDPSTSLKNTLSAYEKSVEWALKMDTTIGRRELDEAKMSLFKGMDAPSSPASEGRSFFKHGITDEMRQTRRDALFACEMDALKDVAERYLTKSSSTVVLGNDKEVTKFASEQTEIWQVSPL